MSEQTPYNNNIESFFKKQLEDYEVAYNPKHWEELEKRLDAQKRIKKMLVGGVAIICASLTCFYFYRTSTIQQTEITTPTAINDKVEEHPIKQHTNQLQNNNSTTITTQEEITNNIIPTEKPLHLYEENEPQISTHTNSITPTSPDVPENSFELSTTNIDAKVQTPTMSQKYPLPNVDFYTNTNNACENTSIQFKLKDASVPADYLWDFGDGHQSTLQSPTHRYEIDGSYSVKVKITSQWNNEVVESKENYLITIYPQPDTKFDWNEIDTDSKNKSYQFIDKTNDAIEWNWDFGDTQTAHNTPEPSITFYKKGNYDIQLIVRNLFNCFDTAFNNITVDKDYNICVPTLFTPNGDGLDDTWIPEVLKSDDFEFELQIFDGNKNLMYKTTDSNQPWDGIIIGTNKLATSGAYPCYINTKDKYGIERRFGGTVTLMR